MKSILLLKTTLILLVASPHLKANDDISDIVSAILNQENFVELLDKHQENQQIVCLVTNNLMPKPEGKIDSDWQVQTNTGVGDVPCIDMVSFKRRENKVVMKFTYADHKVKAKLLKQNGKGWNHTSFTIRGNRTMVMNKEF